VSALRQPPAQAAAKLVAIQEQEKSLPLFFREMTPGFTKINKTRSDIAAARASLLNLLPSK
jgi:hypothetical protein